MRKEWALLLVILCEIVGVVLCGDVVTCGGFVEASTQLSQKLSQRLNYSFVHVHLYTSEGLLKYSTECNPNGYYIIPVYDRGSFYLQIEGPEGWTFDPKRVSFVVKEQENGCSDDINFKFTGFAITGVVKSEEVEGCEGSGGPQGVPLALVDSETNSVVGRTQASENGTFVFSNVFPSNYTVTVLEDKWTIEPKSQSIEMGFDNSALKNPFLVQGFKVHGVVMAGSEPVPNVDVFLYGASQRVQSLPCTKMLDKGRKYPENNLQPLCNSQSNDKGQYAFSPIPCGKFKLIPYYTGQNTVYDVSPVHIDITVRHDDLKVSPNFQVMGFSVSGRVVDRAGNGVSGVTIQVNSFDKAVTDADGLYRLEQITTGSYLIKAHKPDMFFHELKNLQLSPSSAMLPDITVVRYHLCGRVDAGANTVNRDRIILASSSQVTLKTPTDVSGNFCFKMVPGTYTIQPTLSKAEETKGILLSPPKRVITINDKPMLNAMFVQARVAVSGQVLCLKKPCDSHVKVQLIPTGASSSIYKTVETFVVSKGQVGAFSFGDVYPGTYKVRVTHENWCFEKEEKEIAVEYEDATDVHFAQTGYVLHSVLSHPIQLNISLIKEGASRSSPSQQDKSFALMKGDNKFCLWESGVYLLKPVSCYRFEEEMYNYDTNHPQILHLHAVEYQVTGYIILLHPDFQQLANRREKNANVPESVQLLVSPSAEEESTAQVNAVLVDNPSDLTSLNVDESDVHKQAQNFVVYRYTYWSAGGSLTIKPQNLLMDMPKQGRMSFLFYPRKITVHVSSGSQECPPTAPAFVGRVGLYLTGRVTPAVGGVAILVYNTVSSNPVQQVLTTPDGLYRAGPLFDDQKYRVAAQSQGYHFVQEKDDASGNFRALKLGDIKVSVMDEHNKALAGVFLSLSGEEGYRNNNITDDSGSFDFNNLFPGQYYLRPLLKEYRFAPRSVTLSVKEASSEVTRFKATRTAYSVFGKVLALNGEVERDVVVEAVAVDQPTAEEAKAFGMAMREETSTDTQGEYRLRGLIPNKRYHIQVKAPVPQTAGVERASPSRIALTMTANDSYGMDFIAYHFLTKFDISGVVNVSDEYVNTLHVELCQETAPSVAVKTALLTKSMHYFEFHALPVDKYLIRVRSSLSSRTHIYSTPEIRVELSNKHAHLNIDFSAQLRVENRDKSHGSLLTLLMVIVIGFITVYHESIVQFIVGKVQGNGGAANATNNDDKRKQKRK